MTRKNDVSIVIPAYGRPKEYESLLGSIINMEVLPDQVIVCEDFSKERNEIAKISNHYSKQFKEKKCNFQYFENDQNLGYDANVRKLIVKSESKWVVLIGNDDLVAPNLVVKLQDFLSVNGEVAMISRSFFRFENSIENILGISSVYKEDRVISYKNESSAYIFRLCGFVGGLIINSEWAKEFHTDKYDGSLYYQIYLASAAFCGLGIGYISTPIVYGRANNPPLFGIASVEREFHIPGSYTASGRGRMWKAVIDIVQDVGDNHGRNLVTCIRRELMVRQSFHIFEMGSASSRDDLNMLKAELIKLGLFSHWLPKLFFWFNYIFGKRSIYGYRLVRLLLQAK